MEIDCIHFYVVDATRTRDLLVQQMGLRYLGGKINEHTIEYLVGNYHLLFSIASPLNSASPVADYLQLHPSGVRNISFRVPDLDEMRRKIDRLGIEILAVSSEADEFPWLTVRGWGSIDHTIIQASSELTDSTITLDESITGIDHLVLNVAVGELEPAALWYRDLFDFQVHQTFDIHTQKSGLTSQALVSACGKIRFNINQPSSSNSQIQQFLNTNRGAGIQHIALQTHDIFTTIDRMQQQKLAFLPIDRTYYTQLQIRAKTAQQQSLTDDEWQKLQRLQVLMDWTESAPEALLLQIFTQPIFESPTFFFEVIERRNLAKGFGQGNFQSLFEAIEQYNSI
ncbi:4-hydroxyphenylpyruvate dioxygenase [Chamaesiphon sp. VAR_48_metabat_135_sub]|uniref:4-hydroxyphenylpyruvate dioxygenase n=1 Tax=Chamaesiphon sp. VAR_48_metabat_135_sub TaxID=2964699 RepID=UPI00286BB4AC|nr:4-hydroxyphenylpyruvate dioxygenase [Chamaesiphon sp. VAR_48_metabat_135_sub]